MTDAAEKQEVAKTPKLAAAFVKAQAELQNVPMNKTNPHFKSKYADLAAIRDATTPILTAHGLAIYQGTVIVDGGLVLRTRLYHESGEYWESEYPLPLALEKPQTMGSAMTYARRYSWAAACGVAAEDDDDANVATKDAWRGPLPKTRLNEQARKLAAALGDARNLDEFDAALKEYGPVIEQMKVDMPREWGGPTDGVGECAKDRIERMRRELTEKKPSEKLIHLYWPDGKVTDYPNLTEYFDAFRKGLRVNRSMMSVDENTAVLEKLVEHRPSLQKEVDKLESVLAEEPEQTGLEGG